MVAAGSITVAVRVRPPTATEAARLPEPCYDTTIRGDGTLSTPKSIATSSSLREVVQVVDDRILTFDPDEKDRAKAFMERGFLPPGTKRYKDRRFMFDRVFDYEARQRNVYEGTTQPLLKGLLDGYNATVFAYGRNRSRSGIIYLTMADLFQQIEDRRDDYNVDVSVTFLEIYNEEIRDLLADAGSNAPRGGLSIREDKTVKVVGLNELKPNSAEEVKEIVLQGNSRRTQSPTHANETSSRSHAVLQVHITQAPRTASVSEQRTVATLSIIDLAGSERAAATSNMGQRMVEGANINKSLLALGNCINALCESGGAVRHVPYRNSKLTRLLKFSLGGNCKTVMIVCVAPTSIHFDDTHNTLIYAERATKIKTKVVTRNVVNVDRHVGRYVEAINRLNTEIAELKAKISGKNNAESQIQQRKRAEAAAEVERSKEDMKLKFEQTKDSIVDGAHCSGKISVANIKLAAIRARLAELDSQDISSSADLQAERALLLGLAEPEESAIKPESVLLTRLQRSSNSRNMFDATMRAVSERRSEKLDEYGIEMIKLDARRRKAEVEAMKAQQEKDAMKDAVEDLAQLMVALVGMLGRCTVTVGDAGRVLGGASGDDLPQAAASVSSLLSQVKEKNDEAFTKLVGHSTSGYTMAGSTVLDSYKNYTNPTFTRRVSSGPSSYSSSRRSTAYDGDSSSASPRRNHRSPRRVSDKERKVSKSGKSVQWKDEAGSGLSAPPPVKVVPASPSPAERTPNGRNTPSGRTTPTSEWEDDDKTDDSVHLSHAYGSLGSGRRPRASRLDPATTLGSLAEGDESDEEFGRREDEILGERHHRSGSGGQKKHGSPGRRSRRRSNIGALRMEKTRRRSSMIPQLSPPNGETRPAKRVKRISMSSRGMPPMRLKPFPTSTSSASTSSATNSSFVNDGNTSIGDTSINKSLRPTWR
ncbi:kinesin-domain-containing protein [Hymenopellis radicata]|nr:kinesin-domain-containing protein [Hymenopellis radicata]